MSPTRPVADAMLAEISPGQHLRSVRSRKAKATALEAEIGASRHPAWEAKYKAARQLRRPQPKEQAGRAP